MAIRHALEILSGCLAIGASAQAPLNLCTGQDCGYCPNSVTTAGIGFPSCVIYDRDTVLGGSANEYDIEDNSAKKKVYFDFQEPDDPDCRYIVRSPAGNQDENCGEPVLNSRGGLCAKPNLGIDTTFMVQICCGIQQCSEAGISGGTKRDGASGVTTSLVLQDTMGHIIVPHSVGDKLGDKMDVFMEDLGLNASSAVRSRSESGIPIWKIGYKAQSKTKRDCDSYTPDGEPYTKTGSQSYALSGRICGDGSMTSLMNEQSISQSTTFGASVGDPFGIISASTEFTFEESASQSYTYTFTDPEGQCGRVTYTPFFLCTGGTIGGCDGGPQTGEACTALRVNENQVDGSFSFVISD